MASQAAETEAVPIVPPRRVLVADDNIDAAESLAVQLQMAGHEVRVAHNGVEALAIAVEFGPDVALVDLGMPKLDGYETARQMRLSQWGQHTVLIALTGWGQEQDRRRAAEAGFDVHLVKPVSELDLFRALASSRSERRSSDTAQV
jgi:CheY-like chemotaxis protein